MFTTKLSNMINITHLLRQCYMCHDKAQISLRNNFLDSSDDWVCTKCKRQHDRNLQLHKDALTSTFSHIYKKSTDFSDLNELLLSCRVSGGKDFGADLRNYLTQYCSI